MKTFDILVYSLLSLLLFSGCFSSEPLTKKAIKHNKKKVFLLAGQSNMDGRADGDKLSSTDLERLKKAGAKIKFYYNHHPVTPLQLTTPPGYVQKKFNLKHTFGPELFFGINLHEAHPQEEYIFIKRSIGGTTLYGCWNPYWTEEKAKVTGEENKPKLFSDFINYTKDVLSRYDTSEYEICGMLWVQGESDSNKKFGDLPAKTYGDNLINLIKETRKQLNVPDLPFIMFQVGNETVVAGMKKATRELKNVHLIPQSYDKNSPDYYPRNPPPLGHYITESMKRIGTRFFEVWDKNYRCE